MDNETKRMLFDATVWTISLLASLILLAQAAWVWADPNVSPATHPKWKVECSSCHTAYPPQLLPASAWRRIMSGLDQHFGTAASLDAGSIAEVGAFLEQHACTGKRTRGAQTLRITESTWFLREHRKVPAVTWKSPGVKTPANCAACHTKADEGEFRDRNIRLSN